MLCRAVLAAIAISYLLCVLFLSGIQKEDLDVSLLKKLQRHNIDLDDVQFQKECNGSVGGSTKENKNVDFTEASVSVIIPYKETTTLEKHLAELNATEIEDMLTYLKQKKKSRKSAGIDETTNVGTVNLPTLENNVTITIHTGSILNITEAPNMKENSVKNIVNFYETYIKHLTAKEFSKNNTEIQVFNKTTNTTNEPNLKSIATHNNSDADERIGKIVANYMQKYLLSMNATHISAKSAKNETVHASDINSQPNTIPVKVDAPGIEKTFASSIDAINKLNQNIDLLQKKLQTTELLNKSQQANNQINKLAEGLVILPRESVQNIAENIKSQESEPSTFNNNRLPDLSNSYKVNLNSKLEPNKRLKFTKPTIEINRPIKDDDDSSAYNYETKVSNINRQVKEDNSASRENEYSLNPRLTNYTGYRQLIPFNILQGVPYETSEKETSLRDYLSKYQELKETDDQYTTDFNIRDTEKSIKANPNLQNTPRYIPGPDYLTPNTYFKIDQLKDAEEQTALLDVLRYINKIKSGNRNSNSSGKINSNNQKEETAYYIQTTHKTITFDEQKIPFREFLELQSLINPAVSQHHNKQTFQAGPNNLKNLNEQEVMKLKEKLSADMVKVESTNSLSPDTIIKIADSVKDIVLKDLRKEITTSSANTAQIQAKKFLETSTESLKTDRDISANVTILNASPKFSTSTPSTSYPCSTITAAYGATNTSDLRMPSSKEQKVTKTIEKFIELFEQLSNLKEKNMKNTENKINLPSPLRMIARPQPVPLLMYPPPMPPLNTFAVKTNTRNIPLVIQNFIPPVQLSNSPVPPGFNVLGASIPKMQPGHLPPLIQTNVNEIQPLPVPMTKPEPINFHIVLTTQNPLMSKEEKERWNFMMKYGRNPDKKIELINTKTSFNDYSNVKFSQYDSQNFNDKSNRDKTLYMNNSRNENIIKIQNDFRAFNPSFKDAEQFNKLTYQKGSDFLGYMSDLKNNEYRYTGDQQNVNMHDYNNNISPIFRPNITTGVTQHRPSVENQNISQKLFDDMNSKYPEKNNDIGIRNVKPNDIQNFSPSYNYNNMPQNGGSLEREIKQLGSSVPLQNQALNSASQNMKYNDMKIENLKQLYNSNSAFHYQEGIPQNLKYNEMGNINFKPPNNLDGIVHYQQQERIPENMNYDYMKNYNIKQASYQGQDQIPQRMKLHEMQNDYGKQSYNPNDGVLKNRMPERVYQNINYNDMRNDSPKQLYSNTGKFPNQEQETISNMGQHSEIYNAPLVEERNLNNIMDPRLSKDYTWERFSDFKPSGISSGNNFVEGDRVLPAVNNHLKKLNEAVSYYNPDIMPAAYGQLKHDEIPSIMPTKQIISNRPMEQLAEGNINVMNNPDVFENTDVNSRYLKPSTYQNNRDEFKQIYPSIELHEGMKSLEKMLSNPIKHRPSSDQTMALPKLKQLLKHLPHASIIKHGLIEKHYPYSFGKRVKTLPNHNYDISSTYKNKIERNRNRQNISPWFQSKTETNDKRKQKQTQFISALLEGRNKLKNSNELHDYNRPKTTLKYHNYRPSLITESSDEKSRLNSFYDTSDSEKQYNAMDIQGFHEKLEGSDSSRDSPSDYPPDERNHQIQSRNQLPLSGKAKKYNDAHFQRFLKTQQKVNKMLENILATKTDQVKSVESI